MRPRRTRLLAPPAPPVVGPSVEPGRAAATRDGRRAPAPHAETVQVGAAVVAVGVVATLAVVLSGGDSNPKRSAPPSPSPTASGANLLDPNLVATFLGAAASDIAAVTTYDYRNLDDALNVGAGRHDRGVPRRVPHGADRRSRADGHRGTRRPLLRIARRRHRRDRRGRRRKRRCSSSGRQTRITDDTRPDRTPHVSPITLCATIRRDGNRYRISDLVEGANAGLPPGSPDLPAAAEAARAEVTNMLSYPRADFDADLQRALDGATDPLREQLQQNRGGHRSQP